MYFHSVLYLEHICRRPGGTLRSRTGHRRMPCWRPWSSESCRHRRGSARNVRRCHSSACRAHRTGQLPGSDCDRSVHCRTLSARRTNRRSPGSCWNRRTRRNCRQKFATTSSSHLHYFTMYQNQITAIWWRTVQHLRTRSKTCVAYTIHTRYARTHK